jgi:hypothetical protein
LGTGGIFVILVLRSVIEILKARKDKVQEENGGSRNKSDRGTAITLVQVQSLIDDTKRHESILKDLLQSSSEQGKKIEDMHRWHDVDDRDRPGAKLWWALSLPELVKEQKETNRLLVDLMKDLRTRDKGG